MGLHRLCPSLSLFLNVLDQPVCLRAYAVASALLRYYVGNRHNNDGRARVEELICTSIKTFLKP